jgi:hypothetical protein
LWIITAGFAPLLTERSLSSVQGVREFTGYINVKIKVDIKWHVDVIFAEREPWLGTTFLEKVRLRRRAVLVSISA